QIPGRGAAIGSLQGRSRWAAGERGIMSETNDTTDRRTGSSGRLGMRRTTVEQSRVKQSFSHGRSKTVVVETKRKRTPGGSGKAAEAAPQPETKAAPAAPKPEAPRPASQSSRPGVVLRTLTEDEKDARERALADARVR